jgi:hypothetical protein
MIYNSNIELGRSNFALLVWTEQNIDIANKKYFQTQTFFMIFLEKQTLAKYHLRSKTRFSYIFKLSFSIPLTVIRAYLFIRFEEKFQPTLLL